MSHTIFLVEDDPALRGELAALLERYGYVCASTDDYEDVAGQILYSGAHLALLDLNLPRYDGYHICRELRRQSQLPILVVTSRSTELDELMSMNLGADDFLTKPYHTQILLARIGRLLQRAYPAQGGAVLSERGRTDPGPEPEHGPAGRAGGRADPQRGAHSPAYAEKPGAHRLP